VLPKRRGFASGRAFDPHHKWLGIPPKEQPPDHHWRLVVRFFEAHPNVVGNVEDKRMAHVRSLQTGKQGA
jgi:hypothetical protein